MAILYSPLKSCGYKSYIMHLFEEVTVPFFWTAK
jgi:hypothetical protein